MSNPFIAQIVPFPFNFAPTGWAFCAGQILPIQQNTALFSLIGTFYGGNGTSNFALPDLRGRVAIHQGQGSGLQDYTLGDSDGVENVTLQNTQLPTHGHGMSAVAAAAGTNAPSGNFLAQGQGAGRGGGFTVNDYTAVASNSNLAPQAMTLAGNGLPHNNLQPYLTLNFCIALQGVFPSRS